jgi:oxygen-dependent protoporphyrinogen oxidase
MASIVVVGGGVAGLGCAWRLRRAGHDVEVLESEPVPGGRMRSERHGEFVVERGAQFIASGYRNLHGVARALGMEGRIAPLAQARNAVLRDGRLEPGDFDAPLALLRSRLLSTGSKLRLARLLLELRRHRGLLEPLRPERAARLDGPDMASYLAGLVGEEARDYLIAPAIRSTFDSEIEDLSGAFLLLVLKFVAGGFRLQAIEGGLGSFTAALAEQVPVRTGCQVLSVETESSGARVRYRVGERERMVVADAAVVAVPGSLVAELCPKLAPAERGFFESVRYQRGILAHLMLERAPASLTYYGVAFPAPEGLDLYGLAVDHHKPGVAPEGTGLLNAALTGAAAGRLWEAPDATVVELVVENLSRTPVGRLAPVASVVHRWPQMLPRFEPGYLPRLAALLGRTERSPRLAFAGDYLVGPYTEAALTSGMRAASEVVRSLD